MSHQITVLSFPEFRDVVGPLCNPHLTVAVSGGHVPGTLQFVTSEFHPGVPHDRVHSSIEYLHQMWEALPERPDSVRPFLFQAEDVPADVQSVSWESRRDWTSVTLVPDLYYFEARGYEDWLPQQVPWEAREAKVVWRGSTTGLFYFTVEDLEQLPRYRLCRSMAGLGAAADVGLTGVVQTADSDQEVLVRERLSQEGFYKSFLPMDAMTQYRYVLDIDGNSNSWNFMMKLRLGCCVLRVESAWEQWFSDRLRPWVHYVPIAADLSDATEMLAWCLANSAESEAIAARGVQFARDMRFSDELAMSAQKVFLSAT